MQLVRDEELLLALLNSTPVVDGRVAERLDGPAGAQLAERFGGTGSAAENRSLRRVRGVLQRVVHGLEAEGELGDLLGDAVLVPRVSVTGIRWELSAPADERLAARAVIAWSDVRAELPGRLRACANAECHLFLVDHSRPGTARWCSMTTCGNRMKARAYVQRRRT